ncbi:MAK10-like protein [Tanacetum coccineum]
MNVNSTSSVSSARSYPMEDPKVLPILSIWSMLSKLLEVLAHDHMYNADLDKYVESLELGKNGSTFIQSEIPKKIKDPGLFILPCETENVLWLGDETKSYPVGIMRNVEVYVRNLKLLEDFYVTDMEKDPTCPLLVGRGFLATASAVIDCKKSKIAVGEGINRSIIRVKEIGLGARPPYYLKKDFMDNHVLGESEIARDAELNPFKDVLVFRKMNKPPKEGDGAWYIKIEMIDPDGEKFDRVFKSIPTTRKLSEKEKPSDIIDLEHFYDT